MQPKTGNHFNIGQQIRDIKVSSDTTVRDLLIVYVIWMVLLIVIFRNIDSFTLILYATISLILTVLSSPFVILYNQKKVTQNYEILFSRLTARIYQSELKLKDLEKGITISSTKDIDKEELIKKEPVEKFIKQETPAVRIHELGKTPEKVETASSLPSGKLLGEEIKEGLTTHRVIKPKYISQQKETIIAETPFIKPKTKETKVTLTEREVAGYNLENWLFFGAIGFIVLAFLLIVGSIIIDNAPTIDNDILFNAGDILFFSTLALYLANFLIFYIPFFYGSRKYKKTGYLIAGILGLVSLFVIRFSTNTIEAINFLELPYNTTAWLGSILLFSIFLLSSLSIKKLENVIVIALYMFFIFDFVLTTSKEDFYIFALFLTISFMITLLGIFFSIISRNITNNNILLAILPLFGVSISLIHDFSIIRLLEWYPTSLLIIISAPVILGAILLIVRKNAMSPEHFVLLNLGMFSSYFVSYFYVITDTYPVFDFIFVTLLLIIPILFALTFFSKSIKRELSVLQISIIFVAFSLFNIISLPISLEEYLIVLIVFYIASSLVLFKSQIEPINFRFINSIVIIFGSIFFVEVPYFIIIFSIFAIFIVLYQSKETYTITPAISDKQLLLSFPYLILALSTFFTKYSLIELMTLPILLFLYVFVYRKKILILSNFIGLIILSLFYSGLSVLLSWNQEFFSPLIITEAVFITIILYLLFFYFLKDNSSLIIYSILQSIIPLAIIAFSVFYINIETTLLTVLILVSLLGPLTVLSFTLRYVSKHLMQNIFDLYLIILSFLLIVIFWFEEYVVVNFYLVFAIYLITLISSLYVMNKKISLDFLIANFSPLIILVLKEFKIDTLKNYPETPEIVIFTIFLYIGYLIASLLILRKNFDNDIIFRPPALAVFSVQLFLGLFIIFERLSDWGIALSIISSIVILIVINLISKNFFNVTENTITFFLFFLLTWLSISTDLLSETLIVIILVIYLLFWFILRFNIKDKIYIHMFVWQFIILNLVFLLIDSFKIQNYPWIVGGYFLLIGILFGSILLINSIFSNKYKNLVITVNIIEIFFVLCYLLLHQLNSLYNFSIFFPNDVILPESIALIWIISLGLWFFILYYSIKYPLKLKIRSSITTSLFLNFSIVLISGLIINFTNIMLWFHDLDYAGVLILVLLALTIIFVLISSKLTKNIEIASNTLVGLYSWLLILSIAFYSDSNILGGTIALVGAMIWIISHEIKYNEIHNYISLFYLGIAVIHFFLNFLLNFTTITIEFGLIAFLIGISFASIFYYNKLTKESESKVKI
ncbi:MAG: hypothetical protein HeimC3_29320 [Candidatus Heimdallarchaeota archaeon LC_3]|nr:MAG: hypothetical protein HeimC3_29320 [Candidatus Heimdallarchaeota archaeon LC_3]